jgi:hypothetical protein
MDEIETLSHTVHNILYGSSPAARAFDGSYILKRADPEVRRRYSSQLWDVICECTRMQPDRRPTPSQLLAQIQAGVSACVNRVAVEFAATGDATPYEVALEGTHLQELTDGGAQFRKHNNFWNDFGDQMLWSPRNIKVLAPPEAPRWIDFNAHGMPTPLVQRQEQRWAEAISYRDKRPPL